MSSATGPSSSSRDASGGAGEEKADHANDKGAECVTDSETEERITRKFSSASLYSTDGGEDDGNDEDEDDVKSSVLPGPQLALKEQLEMDKDDESLRKWKEQLLAGVDFSAVGVFAPGCKGEATNLVGELRFVAFRGGEIARAVSRDSSTITKSSVFLSSLGSEIREEPLPLDRTQRRAAALGSETREETWPSSFLRRSWS